MNRAVKILGVVTTIGMFLVLVAGATVTNTGSEHGCGRSWPLCHGQLVPHFAVTTMIEFIHRVDAAVETVLILLFAAGVLYLYRRRIEMRVLVILMVVFLFLQAGLGAWAVMEPTEAAVLALHFGVSLVAFASVLLTTILLFEIDGSERLRALPLPRSYRWAVWGLAIYTYAVVYSGAYVRHTNADDGCTGWPRCNGAFLPGLHGKVTSNFGHRVGAGLLTLAVIALVLWTARLRAERPDLFRGSLFVLAGVSAQALAGAAVAWTNMDLFAALAHAATVGLMFGALTYMCIHVLALNPEPREVSRRTVVSAAGDSAAASQ
ncbi:MAG: COX15/CtaA family protein [Chloroflexota bacterium]